MDFKLLNKNHSKINTFLLDPDKPSLNARQLIYIYIYLKGKNYNNND
jgi:hypothetical protein